MDKEKEDLIDDIEDDDVDGALDILEELGIPIDGIEDVAGAVQRIWKHFGEKQQAGEDEVDGVEEVVDGPRREDKYKWTAKNSTEIIQKLISDNQQTNQDLQEHVCDVRDFVNRLPKERKADLLNAFPSALEDLNEVQEQLYEDECVILVAGETSAGKSTLLNLLLGELAETLLPVAHLSTTSAITELKYGEERKMVAYPKDPDDHPKRISLGENASKTLARYVHQKGDRDEIFPYKRVEVFWPCDWLKGGVTIVDTPGVGEDDELTDLVKEYLPKAFAFIYVINTTNAGGIDPDRLQELIFTHIAKQRESVGQFKPRSAMFVCNKWDKITSKEKMQVREHIMDKLQDTWPGFKEEQVFLFSARRTIDQLKDGYVSNTYFDLLRGIETLIPVGLKAKLALQYSITSDILRRCNFILRSFISEGELSSERFSEAKKRLDDLERKPAIIKRELKEKIDQEISFAMGELSGHLQQKETIARLKKWSKADCPKAQNLTRLNELMKAKILKRIRKEISEWDKNNRIFEQIHQTLIDSFKERFIAVEDELRAIEVDFSEGSDMSSSVMADMQILNNQKTDRFSTAEKVILGVTAPFWVPLGLVIGIFALPVLGGMTLFKKKRESKIVEKMMENIETEMADMTEDIVEEVIKQETVKDVISDKIKQAELAFYKMLDRIPALINADRRMLSNMERDLKVNADDLRDEYYPLNMEGLHLQAKMDSLFISDIRAYDIALEELDNYDMVGEGNFAKVYKAKWKRNQRSRPMVVAVKSLKHAITNANATDFLMEEENMRKIQSPNIVKFYGTCVSIVDDRVYPVLVMEYCRDTLDHIISSRGYKAPAKAVKTPKFPQALQQASKYAYQISCGLMAIHAMGFAHRDMKPQNILVSPAGDIKLADLGMAKRIANMTRTMCGTPLYMAPEVLSSQPHDEKADMFGYASLLWELWYGDCVIINYKSRNHHFQKNLQLFLASPFPKGRQQPDETWRDLMLQCWSMEPSKRPTARHCCKIISRTYLDGDPFRAMCERAKRK